jgi:hypothetical protein
MLSFFSLFHLVSALQLWYAEEKWHMHCVLTPFFSPAFLAGVLPFGLRQYFMRTVFTGCVLDLVYVQDRHVFMCYQFSMFSDVIDVCAVRVLYFTNR